jgi:hypothetical protein
MGGGGGGGFSAPDPGGFRQPRGGDSGNRNFGPNKPPKGRGGSNFGKNRNQEGKAKGPLKERLSGRMFSVEEDARFRDADDTLVDPDAELKDLKEEPEVEKDADTEE